MVTEDIFALEMLADVAAAERNFRKARVFLAHVLAAQPGRFDSWVKLAAISRADGDPVAALKAVSSGLALRPFDFVALLMKASLIDGFGREDEAALAYGNALAQVPTTVPSMLAASVENARTRYYDWQTSRARLLREEVAQVTNVTPAFEQFIDNSLRITDPHRSATTDFCYPSLPAIPFHPREAFPWLETLEAATLEIGEEFAKIADSNSAKLEPYINYSTDEPLRQWTALNKSRDWTAIHLITNGQRVETNTRLCPKTMKLLCSIPQPHIGGAGPNAMFSLLAPGAHIPPHTGIANTRLVCHLPLSVPKGCWFRVGKERRDWVVGEAWIFDDTIEHEALNPTNELRVVLIFDIWHPALSSSERAGIAAIIGAHERQPSSSGKSQS
jgi:aspartyl/asparaginyl beta-hydroxylase (cupin superfamily)